MKGVQKEKQKMFPKIYKSKKREGEDNENDEEDGGFDEGEDDMLMYD